MKKLILGASALLISLGMVNAQGWSSKGAHDDFATSTSYANGPNGEGLNWFDLTGGDTIALSRPGDGEMTIDITTAGGCNQSSSPTDYPKCYPVFGVNFGDANHDGTGTPFTVDLSSGADITLDIENTANSDTYMTVKLIDINGHTADVEPNVSDVPVPGSWANDPERKALNGFTLPGGVRSTITIDLSSVPSYMGGLTAGTYDCSIGPGNCPMTSYTIDPSQIKAVLFQVNFGKDDIFLSEGDGDYTTDTYVQGSTITSFTGVVKMYDFTVGNFATGVKDAVIDNSLSVYPNPADEALTVSFKSSNDASVVLTDIVGNKVYSTTGSAGDNNISVNTSNLTTGIYILNITTESGKVARKVNIK